MNTPIYERLRSYRSSNRVSFAMPGHKNGRGIKENYTSLDVTELEATLNLCSESDETVNKAQKLLALLYGADASFILTGGSTSGIQAMLAAALRPGAVVLASSDCHKSVINACAICGFRLRFIPAELDEESLIPYDAEDIGTALDKHEDIEAVIVTSPNYYGMCRDIRKYAEECHKRGIPLLVDEAHGAHFPASSRLPESAIRCGADIAVNSAHKTLNALTGAAYLHIKSGLISKERLRCALDMFRSTSPSYPIAASADAARAELESTIEWNRLIDMCMSFRHMIEEMTYMRVLENDDPTRIVINVTSFDTTGYEVAESLSKDFGIDAEMADLVNVVLIATPSNTVDDFEKLYKALNSIYEVLGVRRERYSFLSPVSREKAIDPQPAFYSPYTELPMTDSIGMTAAKTITAYPPGIPVLCAGEEITAGHILYLRHLKKAGAVFTGFDGIKLPVI